MDSTKFRLRLFVDKTSQKVLYAEAEKDFINFLFSLMTLTVCTVVTLLTKKDMVGSLGRLYQTIEYFDETNVVPGQKKVNLVKRTTYANDSFLQPKFYRNWTFQTYGEVGHVKGAVTYMVMDDLAVEPVSTISAINLLNRLNMKDLGALLGKDVHFGMAEGKKLLKASLQCKTVLMSVFLNNQ